MENGPSHVVVNQVEELPLIYRQRDHLLKPQYFE
jgi:hypothetical protein